MKKAFTLVEIMIIIAIIGLLAAIAIPSFMKAKRVSEALAAGYTKDMANKIATVQMDQGGSKLSIKQAYAIVKAKESDKPVDKVSEVIPVESDQPVVINDLLPDDASDVTRVRKSEWFTFRWRTMKFLVYFESDPVSKTRSIKFFQKLD